MSLEHQHIMKIPGRQPEILINLIGNHQHRLNTVPPELLHEQFGLGRFQLHALDHHRTEEGDAFARAMGGETIAPETDYIDVCCICTGDM